MHYETVWTFKTARFRVALAIAYDPCYQYDGDDENGEIQAALDCGEYVALDSRVSVFLDGRRIAEDHLGGSVYRASDVREFWTAHRDPDPMNRNCSLMRSAKGDNVIIGHYFPGMVFEAIDGARKALCDAPRLRCA